MHHPDVKKHCATEYLNYVRSLCLRIETLQEHIERRKALMLPSGISYTEAVSQSSTGDSIENGIIKLEDLIRDYTTELAEFVEQERIADGIFKRLSKAEYTEALLRYYLQGKSWERVCVETGYSWSGMMKLRREAVLEVYDLMPEEWRRYSIPNAQTGH